MTETYVSTDVESDGPIPGTNSMLSFASVALDAAGTKLGEFEANLKVLPSALPDPETMAWWSTQGPAYGWTRENTQDPSIAMVDYLQWIQALPGKPVFVGYPAGFDFTFIRWYLVHFTGQDPFSFAALDVKTLGMALLNTGFRDVNKRALKRWRPKDMPHTHRAIDDAREQGALFINMLTELRSRA